MDPSISIFVQEIIDDCKKKRINVSAEFVVFLVSLVSLSSNRSSEKEYYEETMQNNTRKMHAAIIQKLLDQTGPSLLTLRTQFHFAKQYIIRDDIIKQYRFQILSKTEPLIKEVCEMHKIDNTKNMEILYQKMLVVITVLSGLGNPIVPLVLREAAIALQSVLQPSELSHYVILSKPEKEEQLIELVYIVAGIRLYNRDCQRGGNDIDDLPSILQAGVNRTHNSIINLLEILMEKVYKFTAAVEVVINNHVVSEVNVDSKDTLWVIEMLLASRQLEIYVRKLLVDLLFCEEQVGRLVCRFENRLIAIHETVKFKTAIPTTQPQFKDLANIWFELQDEVIALSFVNEMLWKLQCFLPKITDFHQYNILNKLLNGVKVLTDAERLEKSMGKLIVDCGMCSLAYPNRETNFDKVKLQFLGFCIWSFVVGNGSLIPGNPNIGVAEWKGKYFAFYSIEAARQFGKYPDRFLEKAIDIVKQRQEYIHFFQLFKDIQIMNREEKLSEEYMPLKICHNQEVQTETHILTKLIDINYSSSIWVHRQRAIQFANIIECKTRSTQTIKTHFRTGVCLQTLIPIEKEVQTGKERGTNTKKLRKYIFGLQNKDNKIKFINCSLEKQ